MISLYTNRDHYSVVREERLTVPKRLSTAVAGLKKGADMLAIAALAVFIILTKPWE